MSLDELINAVKKYRNNIPEKTKEIRNKVSNEILQETQIGFNGAGYDYIVKPFETGATTPEVDVEKKEVDENTTAVVANGKEAIFVEFGAGIYFNGPAGSSPHPWGDRGPYYIGKYGKGNGARKVWYFYDDDGYLRATLGTPASMPMYHATEDVKKRIPDIAREAFKGGEAT